jgi:UDP-N-acetylmuramate--alanine ligase
MSDVLVVTDVYPAREPPIEGVSGELIVREVQDLGHRAVHYVEDKTRLTPFLRTIVQRGDLLITMGAGDIWKIGEEFLSRSGTPEDDEAEK